MSILLKSDESIKQALRKFSFGRRSPVRSANWVRLHSIFCVMAPLTPHAVPSHGTPPCQYPLTSGSGFYYPHRGYTHVVLENLPCN